MGSKIQFTETITTEQMVAQNMSTNTDDDGQLITGGMISIGNNSTNCKFDDTVTVYIPIKDKCIDPKFGKIFEFLQIEIPLAFKWLVLETSPDIQHRVVNHS